MAFPHATLTPVFAALGEVTRLRIVVLLKDSELSVRDLVDILGQSQPRVSRHLKILLSAGLVERHKEGSWAFFRLSRDPDFEMLLDGLFDRIDFADTVFANDCSRREALRDTRTETALAYFSNVAAEWDGLRSRHVSEKRVESALMDLTEGLSFTHHLDLGTGTGHILKLFADRAQQSTGVDGNANMLSVARANLHPFLSHMTLLQSDLHAMRLPDSSFDFVTVHFVLHFLSSPQAVFQEVGRLLTDQGLLIVADFAAHQIEELRSVYNHQRLGFDDQDMQAWALRAGLHMHDILALAPETKHHDLTVKLWAFHKSYVNPKALNKLQSTQTIPV